MFRPVVSEPMPESHHRFGAGVPGERHFHGNASLEPAYLQSVLTLATAQGAGLILLHSHLAGRRPGGQRREESLSREQIIEASIELLDGTGEGGLTFRVPSERLATGGRSSFGQAIPLALQIFAARL